MDLASIKKAYFIGIKGSGMVAIAEILKSRGAEIIGSDTKEKFFTDEVLEKLGIKYFEDFQAENIPHNVDVVIYSTAYNETNNIEFQEALVREIPMMSYPEILGELFNEKMGIAISGTHGKTTTTALLAYAVNYAGANPTAIVGSRVIEWESSSLAGKGKYFIAETDEYQNKLRYYNPFAVVLTSIDWDHPDYFPTFLEYKKVFEDFVARIPRHGFLVVWGDSSNTLEVAKNANCEIIKYGFQEENDFKITNYELQIIPPQRDPAKAVANKNLCNIKS
jgi:UDP-N-acetylmuramate--alanine ligase